MSSIWMGVSPGPTEMRVLAMAGPSETILKARLRRPPTHPRALPLLLAKGHNPFALEPVQDWAPVVQPILAGTRQSLGEVRRLMPVASLTLRTAILPVALVEPYLAALERLGSRIASEQAGISPLSRVWRIYVARRRGRL